MEQNLSSAERNVNSGFYIKWKKSFTNEGKINLREIEKGDGEKEGEEKEDEKKRKEKGEEGKWVFAQTLCRVGHYLYW